MKYGEVEAYWHKLEKLRLTPCSKKVINMASDICQVQDVCASANIASKNPV